MKDINTTKRQLQIIVSYRIKLLWREAKKKPWSWSAISSHTHNRNQKLKKVSIFIPISHTFPASHKLSSNWKTSTKKHSKFFNWKYCSIILRLGDLCHSAFVRSRECRAWLGTSKVDFRFLTNGTGAWWLLAGWLAGHWHRAVKSMNSRETFQKQKKAKCCLESRTKEAASFIQLKSWLPFSFRFLWII